MPLLLYINMLIDAVSSKCIYVKLHNIRKTATPESPPMYLPIYFTLKNN